MPTLLHFQTAEVSDIFDPAVHPTQPGRFCHSVESTQRKKDNLDSKLSFNIGVSEGALPSFCALLHMINSSKVKNMSTFYLFLVSVL